jgi:hypothetical protein
MMPRKANGTEHDSDAPAGNYLKSMTMGM